MLNNLLVENGSRANPAIIAGKSAMSYNELLNKASAIKDSLPHGCKNSAVIFLPNGGAFISALFGIFMSGITAFPLNTRLTKFEISALLLKADVCAVVTSLKYRLMFEDLSDESPNSFKIIYIEMLADCPDKPYTPPEDENKKRPILLMSTSGTTGNVKLVSLSQAGLEYSVDSYIDKMDYTKIPEKQTRYTIGAPFSSIYGLLIVLVCLKKCFTLVVQPDPFTLDSFYKTVDEQKITHYEGGTATAVLMERAAAAGLTNPHDISSLRYLGLAGSKIPAETLRRLSLCFPDKEFWTGYGMTEASPLIAKPDKKMDPDKFDSVGTALNGETIMINAGKKLIDTPFVDGEIVVKGPNVMQGYYKNKSETDKIIKGGFLYTGDIGHFDEDGYLYICGRKKNVIIVRGFNVYPEEIENCLLESGLVSDCMVYGESGEFGNESVFADVVPASLNVKEEDIKGLCSFCLADYKQPQKIFFVEQIEKTSTGKNKK